MRVSAIHKGILLIGGIVFIHIASRDIQFFEDILIPIWSLVTSHVNLPSITFPSIDLLLSQIFGALGKMTLSTPISLK